jgi:hypothetical protein
VLVPVHDDWGPAGRVLAELDKRLAGRPGPIEALLVDDGSTQPPAPDMVPPSMAAFGAVRVLELARNLGHQRAIAVGLCHIRDTRPDLHAVVVMDGDGEDDPADVPRLLAALDANPGTCVFAERTRRSEGLVFRLGYAAYRLVHRVLTGIPVRVGNFSALPAVQVRRLVTVSDLWNHYAASVVQARLPVVRVPTRRARRIAGRSRMSAVGLVVHGLSAMSVFSDRIGVRLLLATLGAAALVLAALVAALVVRFATPLAIPGWTTTAVGLLAVLLVQLAGLVLVFVFVVLAGRQGTSMVPIRDYRPYVEGEQTLWARAEAAATPTSAASSSSSPPRGTGNGTSSGG